jgi:hypothetical protein
MHIIIRPCLSLRLKVCRFDDLAVEGFVFKIPFFSCSVFYSSADKLIIDTFHRTYMGCKFVAVGSGDWVDSFNERTESMRKSHAIALDNRWKEESRLRGRVDELENENRILKKAIKIVESAGGE